MFSKLKSLCLAETENMIKDNGFIFLDNGGSILGVAHCDTVFDNRAKENFYHETENYIFSPKLDDRAGIFTLLYFLPMYDKNIKFDILLTTNEEKGASTAVDFVSEKQYNWIFEFDRQGTGAVLYDYEYSEKWTDTVGRNFKINKGSFSDICCLTQLGCCGINVGTGYYSQHQVNSYLSKRNYLKQIKSFINFYHHNKNKHFRYDELEIYGDFDEEQYNKSFYDSQKIESSLFFDDYTIKNSDL